MSTAELKIDLINQITNIEDSFKLNEIRQSLTFQKEESVYVTSEEDEKAILAAKKQVTEGKYITHEQLQEEIKEWLRK